MSIRTWTNLQRQCTHRAVSYWAASKDLHSSSGFEITRAVTSPLQCYLYGSTLLYATISATSAERFLYGQDPPPGAYGWILVLFGMFIVPFW